MDFPKRKLLRLKDYDYGQSGAYFVTICTLQKEPILSRIVDPSRSSGVPGTAHPTDDAFVGNAVPGVPYPLLTPYGKATEKTILEMRQFYPHIRIEHFVIMPIIFISLFP